MHKNEKILYYPVLFMQLMIYNKIMATILEDKQYGEKPPY